MTQAQATPTKSDPRPADPPQAVLCPYCGTVGSNPTQCASCKGLYEPLSRQATQNAMGPWQIRDPRNPHLPGCTYDKVRQAVRRGRIQRMTIVRGPTTRQFWSFACNTPGIAVLLGECHACHDSVEPDEFMCGGCGVVLAPSTDRQSLGLLPVQSLPGNAPPEVVAAQSIEIGRARPATPPVLRPVSPYAQVQMLSGGGPSESTPAAPINGVPSATQRRLRRQVAFWRNMVVGIGAFAVFFLIMMILTWFGVIGPVDQSGARSGSVPPARMPSEPERPPVPAPAQNQPSFTWPAMDVLDEMESEIPEREHKPSNGGVAMQGVAPAAVNAPAGSDPEPRRTLLPGLSRGFDAWKGRYQEAQRLAEEQTIDSLGKAIELLEAIRDEARAETGSRALDTTSLSAQIVALQDLRDDLRLRELLGD